jgi:hypothetical protein
MLNKYNTLMNMNMNTEFEDTVLDDEWIQHFDSTDKLYKDFYKDNLYYINVTLVYINNANEMEKIKQESFLLTKTNQLLYEEMVDIIKKSSFHNKKRYSLLSILKYNFHIEPEDLKYYMCNKLDENFLSIVRNIDTVVFEKTINMFHDLNDLILVFYEKEEPLNKLQTSNNTTKKVYLYTNTGSSSSGSHSHKKTIKKRYKE